MKTDRRQRQTGKVWEQHFGLKSRPEVEFDSESLGFSAHALNRVVHKVRRTGTVDLGPGRFEGLTLDREVEVLSRDIGSTEIAATVTASVVGCTVLRGVTIRPSPGEPAIDLKSGTLICDDCALFGSVRVAKKATLYLNNARIVCSQAAILLDEESEAEIVACRISGSPAGIFVMKGATCALYNSRIEACEGDAESQTGAGLYATYAALTVEGCEFFGNQVGLYLKSCAEVSIVNTHFLGNSTAGLVTEEAVAHRALRLTGCLVDASGGQQEGSPIALHGGSVFFQNCQVLGGGLPALSTSGVVVRAENSTFSAVTAAAMDLQGGSISAADCEVSSQQACAINADGTSGEFQRGNVSGTAALAGRSPGGIRIAGNVGNTPRGDSGYESAPVAALDPDNLQSVLSQLGRLIGQPGAKAEFARMLRLAFAARQRRKQGLPPGELKLSAAFVGPPGSGKTYAAGVLAEALHHLGELDSPEVVEVSLADVLNGAIAGYSAGIIVIETDPTEGLVLAESGNPERLLVEMRSVAGRSIVVLDGEREPVLAVLRAFPELARDFPFIVPFTGFGPPELAALFHQLCLKEGIRLSLDASRALPVVMHGLHDRLQLRFAGTGGVAEIFEQARQNYFERCARAQCFDLEMETGDLSVPVDRSTASVLERCADMVALCPACGAENPWVPGLTGKVSCLSCGKPLPANFGIWRPSTYFRKLMGRKPGLKSGAVAMRRTLADAIRKIEN
jgi:hypothetical protein